MSNPEVVLLVGGLGTRLRSELSGLPKPMVDVGGRPFLERMLRHLQTFDLRIIVLAISFGGEIIEASLGTGESLGVSISYSREIRPLGTGGALRNALALLRGNQILVLNGDSFVDVDYREMLKQHILNGAKITIAAVYKTDCRDFGRLHIRTGNILEFQEKRDRDEDASSGYINAGVYVMERRAIESIEPNVIRSLEMDIFPSFLSGAVRMNAFCTHGYFADLGTPNRLQQLRMDFSKGLVPFRGQV